MTDTSASKGNRPRSTVAQWITAATLVVILAVVVGSFAFAGAVLDAFGNGIGELEDDQGFQEVVCLPYATGVLDLAAQGYTAEQIEAAYAVAAAPHEGTEPRDDDAPASLLVEYCGNPAEVLAAAPSTTGP